MKAFILTTILCFFSAIGITQNISDTNYQNHCDTIALANSYDTEVSFVGGELGWKKYLQTNLNINNYESVMTKIKFTKKNNSVKDSVEIEFLVLADGNLCLIKPSIISHKELVDEAMRLIKSSPKWNPATKNNIPIKAFRRQKFYFQFHKE